MHQERRGTGRGVATDLGPIDFAAVARACGARGVRVEPTTQFEPALRAALAATDRRSSSSRSTGRWVSVDQPPRSDAATPTTSPPSGGLGRGGPGRAVRGRRRSRTRGSSTAPTGSTSSSRRSTGTTADPRPFVVLTVDLDAVGGPWRYDDPGSPYPHIYGPIARAAIVVVNVVERASDGRLTRLGDVTG